MGRIPTGRPRGRPPGSSLGRRPPRLPRVTDAQIEALAAVLGLTWREAYDRVVERGLERVMGPER